MSSSRGIDLDQYRTQAKELLKQARAGDPHALERMRRHHAARAAKTDPAMLRLADAQLVIARENGLPSWPKFKELILFRNAVAALDAGDVPRLSGLLEENPRLVDYACWHGAEYESGYFAGATLLEHVAGNPVRAPLPPNIVAVARLLLERGAGRNRARLQRTIGLLLTSRQASQAGVALPLIDLLVAAGAAPPDLGDPALLDGPLQNLAPQTADALIRRGARMELRHAAALGRSEIVRSIVEGPPSEKSGASLVPLSARPMEAREQLAQAFAAACSTGRADVAEYLLDHGAEPTAGRIGGQSGFHAAVAAGHLEVVRMLVRRRAALEHVNAYGGTVLAQALWSAVNEPHPNHPAIIELLIEAGARFEPSWKTGIREIDQLLERRLE